MGQNVHGIALLDHAAALQDGDVVGHVGHDAQVMADQHQGHVALLDKVAQQVENLLLQDHIERGRRFIGNEDARIHCAGDGDHDALPLAAGEFMRIAVERELRRRKPDPFEHCPRARFGIGTVAARVPADAFRHLLPNGLDRIEGGHGFLKDHADVIAAQPGHRRLIKAENVASVEQDRSFGTRLFRQQANGCQRGHGLARSAFADDGVNAPGAE